VKLNEFLFAKFYDQNFDIEFEFFDEIFFERFDEKVA
jgi:hypothetical protein